MLFKFTNCREDNKKDLKIEIQSMVLTNPHSQWRDLRNQRVIQEQLHPCRLKTLSVIRELMLNQAWRCY